MLMLIVIVVWWRQINSVLFIQLGLLGIPGLDDDENMSEDDEADLEDELLAMLGEEVGSSSEKLIPAVQKKRLSPVVHPDLVGIT